MKIEYPTKVLAEELLNDMTEDQLPSGLAALIPKDYEGLLLGSYFRRSHRHAFDQWYDKIYFKNHLKAIEHAKAMKKTDHSELLGD